MATTENTSILSPARTTMTIKLICFVHPKSGGSGAQGSQVLDGLRELFGNDNVHDITKVNIAEVIKSAMQKYEQFRILVGGGDGSQSWILSELDKLDQEKRPAIAPLAMGTGNDLSRILGWGGGYDGGNLESITKQVINGRCDFLDRWKISSEDSPDSIKLDVINNYCSIGLDALIGYKFHEKRTKHPDRFTSRRRNKMVYTCTTAEHLFKKDQKLHKLIKLICDGKDYTEQLVRHKPKTLLLLNISSYAGGHDLWGCPNSNSQLKVQSPNDEKLDVCIGDRKAMLSSLCFGTSVTRVCQASEIEIQITDEPVAFQIDGEPWIQPSSKVKIGIKNSVPVVIGPKENHSTCVLCCKTSSIKY